MVSVGFEVHVQVRLGGRGYARLSSCFFAACLCFTVFGRGYLLVCTDCLLLTSEDVEILAPIKQHLHLVPDSYCLLYCRELCMRGRGRQYIFCF